MPEYESEKGEKKSGMPKNTSDARLSSNKGWSPPQGMPDPPGETMKIPHPE